MNKKILAVAVAGAFVAPAAMADTGNVTIYGTMHGAYESVSATGGDAMASTGLTTSGQNANSSPTRSRISSHNSFMGFKGSEDLGNGTSAIWQVESTIGLDSDAGSANTASGVTAAGQFTARNTFVGLSSKTMGTVLFGRHDTPYKMGTGKLDVFSDTIGDYNSIMGNMGASRQFGANTSVGTNLTTTTSVISANAAGAGTTVSVAVNTVGTSSMNSSGATRFTTGSNGFDLRPANVLAYVSPTVNGFHGAIAYVANELKQQDPIAANTSGINPNAWSLVGVYDNGPLFVSLGYEKHTDLAIAGVANGISTLGALTVGTGTAGTTSTTTTSLDAGGSSVITTQSVRQTLVSTGQRVAVAANTSSDKAWKLGLGYNFGNTKVGFVWEKIKLESKADAGTTTIGTVTGVSYGASTATYDRSSYYLSLAHQMGANSLKLAYAKANAGSCSVSTTGGAAQTCSTEGLGASQWTIGVDHNMSKRTKVYALYTRLDNKASVSNQAGSQYDFNAGAVGNTTALGANPSGFALGMKHSF